mmetsp:Transcript_25262/g.66755  ORF Transcript_25262/g.66755 Transcript_25262/m.66755 type:complete len:330 (-) Transcript_25262:3669-4658(-)
MLCLVGGQRGAGGLAEGDLVRSAQGVQLAGGEEEQMQHVPVEALYFGGQRPSVRGRAVPAAARRRGAGSAQACPPPRQQGHPRAAHKRPRVLLRRPGQRQEVRAGQVHHPAGHHAPRLVVREEGDQRLRARTELHGDWPGGAVGIYRPAGRHVHLRQRQRGPSAGRGPRLIAAGGAEEEAVHTLGAPHRPVAAHAAAGAERAGAVEGGQAALAELGRPSAAVLAVAEGPPHSAGGADCGAAAGQAPGQDHHVARAGGDGAVFPARRRPGRQGGAPRPRLPALRVPRGREGDPGARRAEARPAASRRRGRASSRCRWNRPGGLPGPAGQP